MFYAIIILSFSGKVIPVAQLLHNDDDFGAIFGKILLQFRLDNNLNQAQAAKLCGLSINKWISLERGEELPQKNTMIRICKAFNVPQKDFLQQLASLIDSILEQHKKSQS